jgi:hypothetical protein
MSERVHRIRLVGPWEWTSRPAEDESDWRKIRLPDDWESLCEVSGSAIFRRRFHCPTGIEATDKVFVVIDADGFLGTVQLNGSPLGCIERLSRSDQSYEVTDRLLDHNLLTITFEDISSSSGGGLVRPVVLEIVSQA